jgi:hypothetical protein
MIRIVRFPASRPHIWIDDVSEYVFDGSHGQFHFNGPTRAFSRVHLPLTTKMITYETPNPYEDVCEKHGCHVFTVEVLHVDIGEDTSEGEWDAELGGYLILTPTCRQTVYFRVLMDEGAEVSPDLEPCDILSMGGGSDIEHTADDDEFVLLE